MAHYYETQVAFEKTTDTKTGPKIKIEKENYLVEGDSVTFVEARVAKFLSDCKDPFEVKVVRESKLVEVLPENGVI